MSARNRWEELILGLRMRLIDTFSKIRESKSQPCWRIDIQESSPKDGVFMFLLSLIDKELKSVGSKGMTALRAISC